MPSRLVVGVMSFIEVAILWSSSPIYAGSIPYVFAPLVAAFGLFSSAAVGGRQVLFVRVITLVFRCIVRIFLGFC
jgi:hypothetical protein